MRPSVVRTANPHIINSVSGDDEVSAVEKNQMAHFMYSRDELRDEHGF
jgi:hypothetical protein